MVKRYTYLSLGAGLQSSLLALMIANGDLPQYSDARIVFADTGGEMPETYRFIEEVLEPHLNARGYEIIKLTHPNGPLLERFRRKGKIPLGWVNPECSYTSKKQLIWRYYREMHGIPDRNGKKYLHHRHIRIVELLGISVDEISRAKQVPEKWIERRYPLIDMGLQRQDLPPLYRKYGIEPPPKSGCWFCPNRGIHYFRRLKERDPQRFKILVEIEKEVERMHPGNPPTFIHRFPLKEMKKQLSLDDFGWGDQMCDGGYCMV